jgi:hypothetical protein
MIGKNVIERIAREVSRDVRAEFVARANNLVKNVK